MAHLTFRTHYKKTLAACILLSGVLLPAIGSAQLNTQSSPTVVVTVNSAADGPVQPDSELTLREAIALTNGTLTSANLSTQEQQLVRSVSTRSEIRFDLPAGRTTIELVDILPAITTANTVIDGTTQAGYDAGGTATAEIEIPIPVVVIRPADDAEVFRGLTVAADGVTVRGLSMYGFNANSQITQSTPPADIFISHRAIPLNRDNRLDDGYALHGEYSDRSPAGVVIEKNWLGLPPDETFPKVASSFGVSVFDSSGTTIRQNRIENHNGSGIITGRRADNLEVLNNIIVGNGISGMPDAIRMDGSVNNSLISDNLLCGNDGSGVFLFKPQGAVTIANNDIRFNGQRLRRAAVYVMGDNHRIINNNIANQKGGGVVVTAFGQGPNTQSRQNIITSNRFSHIEGLSIDLNARRTRQPQSFQKGDGPNPRRNSHNRRQDTGNSAVNAPLFASADFFVIDDSVVVTGQADADNEIQLYRSLGDGGDYGPLSEPIATTTADEFGSFEFVLDDLVRGEVLSAIATDPRYGTSEPARNTVVRSLDGTSVGFAPDVANMPVCTTPLAPPAPPAVELPPEPAPQPIRLEVPRNVHFALDKDNISPESAVVLDRIAAVLNDYPSIIVDLHGHTDSRASQSYNQDLARRRAENARRYLLSVGVGSERMTIRSLGETELLVEETDSTNFARNRRVEFVFEDIRGADITFVNQETDLQIEP